MKRTSSMAVLLVLAALLHQCADRIFDPVEVREKRDLTSFEKQLVQSGNVFGIELFKKINEFEQDKNIFISPLSVSMALGMTLNGADGTTFEAMQSTLELSGMSQTQINESYQSLIELLSQLDPKVIFNLANSIWYRQGFQVEQEFIKVNQTYFDAAVRELDFASSEAVRIINGWVDDKTNGKIEKIVERITPDIVMFLINAIYFKGTWTYEFEKNKTKDDQFAIPSGSTVPVKMMVQEGDFNYLENEDFQAIDLPYGDGDFSMLVILPKPGKTTETIIDQMSTAKWQEWIGAFDTVGVKLEMPRFKLEYKLSLVDVLDALGMGVAFDLGRADFSRINKNGGLYISEVLHKTFVEVNEEGTEAAAVTAVIVSDSAVGGSPVMRVDRPFFFFVRENRSQTNLFMGKIVEPEV
jgi:serpin B